MFKGGLRFSQGSNSGRSHSTAVFRTKIQHVYRCDSIRILCLRGGILQNTGATPVNLPRRILVCELSGCQDLSLLASIRATARLCRTSRTSRRPSCWRPPELRFGAEIRTLRTYMQHAKYYVGARGMRAPPRVVVCLPQYLSK